MSNFDEIFIKEMSPIDAYNYGRQEAEKELQGLKDLGKLYSEIRADAIEEYKRKLTEGSRE